MTTRRRDKLRALLAVIDVPARGIVRLRRDGRAGGHGADGDRRRHRHHRQCRHRPDAAPARAMAARMMRTGLAWAHQAGATIAALNVAADNAAAPGALSAPRLPPPIRLQLPDTARRMSDHKILLVVACALVDADRRVLIAQRPPGKQLAGLWEFPGGKLEPGETPGGGADPRTRGRAGDFDQDGVPRTVNLCVPLLRKLSSSDATFRLPEVAGNARGARAFGPQMGAPAESARLPHAAGRRTADRAALRSAVTRGRA